VVLQHQVATCDGPDDGLKSRRNRELDILILYDSRALRDLLMVCRGFGISLSLRMGRMAMERMAMGRVGVSEWVFVYLRRGEVWNVLGHVQEP